MTPDIWVIVGGAVALVASVVGAFFAGKKSARSLERARDAEGHIETERKVRDATTPGDDVDAARDRMRDRAK